MDVLENELLKYHTTMKVGGPAKYFITANTIHELIEAYKFAKQKNLPLEVIGDGSNIIFTDSGFDGVVVKNNTKGFKLNSNGILKVNAGEKWDEVVKKSVQANFSGLEALSWIPGTVGGAPVNNIGAYGQECKDTLLEIEALDTTSGSIVTLNNKQCNFSYRDSIFKSLNRHKYIILSVTFALNKVSSGQQYNIPNYKSLQQKLLDLKINNPTIKDVRNAVIKLRKSKLPDPTKIPNTGSFFKNPIVSNKKYNLLLKNYAGMPAYSYSSTDKKLYSGWLLETAGLKQYSCNGIGPYQKQALVITNTKDGNYKDLEIVFKHIQKTVYDVFEIKLEIEPEIIKWVSLKNHY